MRSGTKIKTIVHVGRLKFIIAGNIIQNSYQVCTHTIRIFIDVDDRWFAYLWCMICHNSGEKGQQLGACPCKCSIVRYYVCLLRIYTHVYLMSTFVRKIRTWRRCIFYLAKIKHRYYTCSAWSQKQIQPEAMENKPTIHMSTAIDQTPLA